MIYINKLNCKKTKNIITIIIFSLLTILAIIRAKYGFSYTDESLYIALPKRFATSNDSMIYDEYHIIQLSSFICIPIYKLYTMIINSQYGEYVILHFRYIFIFIRLLCGLVFYKCFSKTNWLGSILGVSCFLIYAPFNIMALSYNTMGIMFYLLACSIYITNINNKKINYFISGLLFAFSVLCCPFLVIVYVIYCAYCLFEHIRNKKNSGFILFTIGCGVITIIFIVFLLSRATISQIIGNIPLILNNEMHSFNTNYLVKLIHALGCSFIANKTAPICFGCLAITVAAIFLKKDNKFDEIIFCFSCFTAALYMYGFYITELYVNYFCISFAYIGYVAYFLSKKTSIIRRIFCFGYLPSLMYAILIYFSTDQGFTNVSSVGLISSMFSIMLAINYVKECNSKRVIIAFMITYIIFFASIFVRRVEDNFWDSNTEELTYQIKDGPGKGLLTSKANYEQYYSYWNDIKDLLSIKDGKVLYYSRTMWMQLADTKQIVGHSVEIGVYYKLDKIYQYLQERPDNIPDYVVLDKKYLFSPEEFLDYLNLKGSYVEKNMMYIITIDK